MKRIIALALILLICLPFAGCIFGAEQHTNVAPDKDSIGAEKVFKGDGYSITLTDRFNEKESTQGFDGYYVADFCGVMVKIEPFSLADYLEGESVAEYLRAVAQNNGHDAEISEEDGLTYYRYYRSGNAGWEFAYKGSDAFFLVQFICREDHEEALNDFIMGFAKSVIVD